MARRKAASLFMSAQVTIVPAGIIHISSLFHSTSLNAVIRYAEFPDARSWSPQKLQLLTTSIRSRLAFDDLESSAFAVTSVIRHSTFLTPSLREWA